jgi:hypothetical protein
VACGYLEAPEEIQRGNPAEGEVKDAVLDSGEAFTVRNGGLTVITALRTSALALLEAPSAAPGIEPDVPHRFKASAELVACN